MEAEGILNLKILPVSLSTPIRVTEAVLQLTVAVKLQPLSYILCLTTWRLPVAIHSLNSSYTVVIQF